MAKASGDAGGMTVLQCSYTQAKELLEEIDTNLVIGNHNGPKQVVVSGLKSELDILEVEAKKRKLSAKRLPVGAAFHSPIMTEMKNAFSDFLASRHFESPKKAVYSNYSSETYGGSVDGVLQGLTDQLAGEVRFVEQIENMYEDGARVFLELGPSKVLEGLVKRILKQDDVTVLSFDQKSKNPCRLDELLAQLFCLGVDINWDAYRKQWQKDGVKRPSFCVEISGANHKDPEKESKLKPRPPETVVKIKEVPVKQVVREGAKPMTNERSPSPTPKKISRRNDASGFK